MSCLAALGREGPLRSHIRGALNIGFTQDQIIEVFGHMTLYAGIPFARGCDGRCQRDFRQRVTVLPRVEA